MDVFYRVGSFSHQVSRFRVSWVFGCVFFFYFVRKIHISRCAAKVPRPPVERCETPDETVFSGRTFALMAECAIVQPSQDRAHDFRRAHRNYRQGALAQGDQVS